MTPALRTPWGWPLVLAILSAVGLVAGLLGDGAWDWLAWIGLGAPCGVGIRFGLRGRGRDARGAR